MEREARVLTESSENPWQGFMFHHRIPLEFVSKGIVSPNYHETGEVMRQAFEEGAYRWIERELSFYPLFLSVGETERDVRTTGYQNQWLRGEEGSNQVLFSFRDLPGGAFIDSHNWYYILNGSNNGYKVSDYIRRLILKPSLTRADWLRHARKNPGYVELVTPALDLGKADLISVRNTDTKRQMEELGFPRVEVRRVSTR